MKARFDRHSGPIGLNELFKFYQEKEPNIKRSTFNWRIFELVKRFELRRIGRGQFELGQESVYFPRVNEKIKEIDRFIKDNFPYAAYCVWDTSVLNEFAHHLHRYTLLLVDVERDVAESVYLQLKEKFKPTFFRIDPNLLNDMINDFNNSILVRNLVSESPLLYGAVTAASLEKLLVDVFCDPEFQFLEGSEMQGVFRNAFAKYTVNYTKLLRYAGRKGKKMELSDFIYKLNQSNF